MTMGADRGNVTVVIPVRPWRLDKTGLDVDVEARYHLSRAFTLDVLDAVAGSARVARMVVVTAEAELGATVIRLGGDLMSDRPLLSADSLNLAIRSGRRWGETRRPDNPILVVPGDLPSLTSRVLDETIDLMIPHAAAFVPDAGGRGTTLSWGARPGDLKVGYGPRSADTHVRLRGERVVEVDLRARLDVDTVADLAHARHLGVGSHTSAALDELDLQRRRRLSHCAPARC